MSVSNIFKQNYSAALELYASESDVDQVSVRQADKRLKEWFEADHRTSIQTCTEKLLGLFRSRFFEMQKPATVPKIFEVAGKQYSLTQLSKLIANRAGEKITTHRASLNALYEAGKTKYSSFEELEENLVHRKSGSKNRTGLKVAYGGLYFNNLVKFLDYLKKVGRICSETCDRTFHQRFGRKCTGLSEGIGGYLLLDDAVVEQLCTADDLRLQKEEFVSRVTQYESDNDSKFCTEDGGSYSALEFYEKGYENNQSTVHFRCSACEELEEGPVVYTKPVSKLSQGCPYCSRRRQDKARELSFDEVRKNVEERGDFELVNTWVETVGKNSRRKITIRCIAQGHEYSTTYTDYCSAGTSCCKCCFPKSVRERQMQTLMALVFECDKHIFNDANTEVTLPTLHASNVGTINAMRVDFVADVEGHKVVVEYNGKHHRVADMSLRQCIDDVSDPNHQIIKKLMRSTEVDQINCFYEQLPVEAKNLHYKEMTDIRDQGLLRSAVRDVLKRRALTSAGYLVVDIDGFNDKGVSVYKSDVEMLNDVIDCFRSDGRFSDELLQRLDDISALQGKQLHELLRDFRGGVGTLERAA